jgi:hypothetical protein
MLLTHGLFLTWTQKSRYLQIIYYNSYATFTASFNPTPCSQPSHVYLLREPTSLLVVANIHPLLSLVCPQLSHPLLVLPPFHTPQIKLQYLHRRHQQLQPSLSSTITVYGKCDIIYRVGRSIVDYNVFFHYIVLHVILKLILGLKRTVLYGLDPWLTTIQF